MSSNQRRTPATSVDERIRAKERKHGIVRNNNDESDSVAGAVQTMSNSIDENADNVQEYRNRLSDEENQNEAGNDTDVEAASENQRQSHIMLAADVQYGQQETTTLDYPSGISGVVIEEAVAVKPIRPPPPSQGETPLTEQAPPSKRTRTRPRSTIGLVSVVASVFVVVAVVIIVAVLVSRNNNNGDSSPNDRCSLCPYGSPPPSAFGDEFALELQDGTRFTCNELHTRLWNGNWDDDVCYTSQVVGSLRCGCGTPHPEADCWICPSGALPATSRLDFVIGVHSTCLDQAVAAASLRKDDPACQEVIDGASQVCGCPDE